jgi:hypothetical protein
VGGADLSSLTFTEAQAHVDYPLYSISVRRSAPSAMTLNPQCLRAQLARCCRTRCRWCKSYIRGNLLGPCSGSTFGCTQSEGWVGRSGWLLSYHSWPWLSGCVPCWLSTRGLSAPRPFFTASVRRGGLDPRRTLPLGLLLCYTISMKKARTAKQKVMGRPRTGITPLMGFRADAVIRASIVRWAEKQPDMPTLSEAIRRLVEIGLRAKK